jgi:hypothetical protein
MYEKGYPDIKQNYEQAFNHYYNACNHQVPEAYTHLGEMYKHVTIERCRVGMCDTTRGRQRSISGWENSRVTRRATASWGPAVSSSSRAISEDADDCSSRGS